MSAELLKSKEILSQVGGLAVATKTMSSLCPLADMVARSGMDSVFKFSPVATPFLGQDYQIVVKGGDYKGLTSPSVLYASNLNPSLGRNFNVVSGVNFTTIGICTYLTDNHSRMVQLNVALKGIRKIDYNSGYQLLTDIFPNLTFKPYEESPEEKELKRLASQNIVPHPAINQIVSTQ